MEKAALPTPACNLPREHGERFGGAGEAAVLGDRSFMAHQWVAEGATLACADRPTCVAVLNQLTEKIQAGKKIFREEKASLSPSPFQ